jgi:hypothetical protein
MAIYCSKCGKQHPDDANFCMGCGHPFKAGGQPPQAMPKRWEYKDITIQFPDDPGFYWKGGYSIATGKAEPPNQLHRVARNLVYKNIEPLTQQGWSLDGTIDTAVDFEIHSLGQGFLSSACKFRLLGATVKFRKES